MADDIKIQGSINIDTSGAKSGVEDAKKSIEGAGDALEKTGQKANQSTGLFNGLKSKLGESGGAFKEVTSATGLFDKALNVLKANPIILVLTAIVGILVAAFNKMKDMEAVSDALNKAFAKVSGVITVLTNAVLKPLIDVVVGAINVIGNLATKLASFFGNDVAMSVDRLGELDEKLDDLNDTEMDSAITRAESNRLLQETRDLANDANVPIKDRIEALKKAGKIEYEELTKSIQINQQRASFMLEKLALEINARDEVINKIRSGNIEQMKAARAELMLNKSINKDKIKEIDALIIAAEDGAAQRAKINKKVEQNEKSLIKEQEAADKERKQKAADEQKKAEAELKKYLELKRKLTNDNEQALITDQVTLDIAKQREQLEQQKKQIEGINVSNEKKLELIKLAEQSFANESKKIRDKAQKEKDDKERESTIKFNEELSKLRTENLIAAIKDERAKEQVQLDLSYAEKFEKAKEQYKNDAVKLEAVKVEIANSQRIAQEKLEQKWKDEDDKKKKDKQQKESDLAKELNDKGLSPEELELQKLDDTYKKKFEIAEGNEDLMTETIRAYEEERTRIKQENADKQIGIASGLAGTVSDVIGKETAVGKGLAIAEATINTYLAASQVLRDPKMSLLAKIAGVAAALATGFKTVKGISSVQVPKGGSGGGSASVPAPISPQQASTQLNAASIQGVGNAAQGGVNRSFVLESDISNNQERLARIQRAARLG